MQYGSLIDIHKTIFNYNNRDSTRINQINKGL